MPEFSFLYQLNIHSWNKQKHILISNKLTKKKYRITKTAAYLLLWENERHRIEQSLRYVLSWVLQNKDFAIFCHAWHLIYYTLYQGSMNIILSFVSHVKLSLVMISSIKCYQNRPILFIKINKLTTRSITILNPKNTTYLKKCIQKLQKN